MRAAPLIRCDAQVDTMVSYGISYTARAGSDERGGFTSELGLDPALDEACHLEGLEERPTRRVVVTAMRQARGTVGARGGALLRGQSPEGRGSLGSAGADARG